MAVPLDMGLLPGTFIMPTGANKPSIFRDPSLRWKLEWHRLKTRFADLSSVLYYKYGLTKPRPKIQLRKTAPTAVALHKQMYTAFADSDVELLTSICTDGLLESFRSRIASRRPGELVRWTLHRYTRSPRVVSHRAVVLPVAKGAALRQAVVRIQSRQSLARISGRWPDGVEKVVKGTGEEKEVREYVVVQKRMWKEKEGPWMVWGTTEETSVDQVLAGHV